MRVFAISLKETFNNILGFVLFCLLYTYANCCQCQSTDLEQADTVVYLPVYSICNQTLADSIESAISQLESNWNYYDEYGYVLVLNFATLEATDSLRILISIHSVQIMLPLVTFRPIEYVKTIGCAKVNGYLIIIDACSFVSREEINHYIKCTNNTMRFELMDCGQHKSTFCAWPFNQMVFWVPLQNKDNFVPPDEWHKYKKNMRE